MDGLELGNFHTKFREYLSSGSEVKKAGHTQIYVKTAGRHGKSV
jgi:hypothetical protein